jgi:hypothetical protein
MSDPETGFFFFFPFFFFVCVRVCVSVLFGLGSSGFVSSK